MNAGFFVKNFPMMARQLTTGDTITVWVASEAFDVTRTGPGVYAFLIREAPQFNKSAPQR